MGSSLTSSVLPLLVGGLVLFLYAIKNLSDTLRGMFSKKAEKMIARYTGNIFMAIGIGTLVTIVLDSSSAVIILVIIFINAGTLNFHQAMGIIMGANIGTTFSSQLIALSIGKYAVIPMVIGFVIWVFASAKYKKAGKLLLYFGMLFFGLHLLEISVAPLKGSDFLEERLLQINNPVTGALAGGLITLIIQSSSATMGMIIVLSKQGFIQLGTALSVMLGAELGTCSDTLLAVIGGRRDAVRAGVFHLIFNLVPILAGLLFFDYLVKMVSFISGNAPLQRQIANGHVLFSILSVLMFLPFIKVFYRFLYWLIPEKKRQAV
ncbi:Na/Pi symporter [Ascidiimonas aurantiaca]|uniref:Na/Pi cotransporter family protein n=1 Tax=Ascidiimonas aurantiaca TaxID=1685432 RepID=UPI0030EB759A